MQKALFARFSLLTLFGLFLISVTGCVPLGGNSGGGYREPRYDGGYSNGGYGNGGYYDDRRDRREIERERDQLERERRRLEEERRRNDIRYIPPPPPPPPRPQARENCPSGYSPSERKCSNEERRKGCKDMRLSSGLGCVRR